MRLLRPASVRSARAATLALLAMACGGEHEFDPPDRSMQVARADSILQAVSFDTIAWESESARLFAGNELYAAECRQCHGYLGRGETDYARERDLDVPSLVEAGWAYAEAPDSVRHRIFVGHMEGMPSWGVGRLSPRDIDAVTYYILEQLRPEVLGDAGN